jgi:hypothetical protein
VGNSQIAPRPSAIRGFAGRITKVQKLMVASAGRSARIPPRADDTPVILDSMTVNEAIEHLPDPEKTNLNDG